MILSLDKSSLREINGCKDVAFGEEVCCQTEKYVHDLPKGVVFQPRLGQPGVHALIGTTKGSIARHIAIINPLSTWEQTLLMHAG